MKVFPIITGPFSANTYIVTRDECSECCIIDPGEDIEKTDAFLTDKNLEPKAILLTHGHFDHIGAVNFLKTKYSCPVIAHEDEVELLGSAQKNLSQSFSPEPIVVKDVNRLVSDLEVFCVAGLEFVVIHTPGHSKGSVVYRCENTLFTGDTLFCNCCGRCDLWSSSVEDMRRSLDRLFSENENLLVCSGHGPSTTLDEQRQHYKTFI